MICICPLDCTDFSGNDPGLLTPQICTLTEVLNELMNGTNIIEPT